MDTPGGGTSGVNLENGLRETLLNVGVSPCVPTVLPEARSRNHVCSTWGDFHYKTFDGDVFRFPGLCDYNFASDCRDSYKEFAVHLKRGLGKAGGHSQIESVLITIKDDTIYLTHKLAVVNGAMCVRLLLFFHVPAAREMLLTSQSKFVPEHFV